MTVEYQFEGGSVDLKVLPNFYPTLKKETERKERKERIKKERKRKERKENKRENKILFCIYILHHSISHSQYICL